MCSAGGDERSERLLEVAVDHLYTRRTGVPRVRVGAIHQCLVLRRAATLKNRALLVNSLDDAQRGHAYLIILRETYLVGAEQLRSAFVA